ncbi:helix-turn-helix domain-containing protein [Vreelandella andesensis]|uniref:helix-turn-helix domain-containing protein n=1 Tax=Vreelandella andesensis TaxID=447567 RepID=UPI00142DF674|nr:helix-turn-helix domain-containing protein [Halomonas andesensis]
MATKHLSPEVLNERRKQAVRLRLDGYTVAVASQQTGLSAPTVSAAWKAFREGGWAAVPVKPRGRLKGQANVLSADIQALLWQMLYQEPQDNLLHTMPGWGSADLAEWLNTYHAVELSQRAIEHWWEAEGLKHEPWRLNHFAKQRSQEGRWFRKSVLPRFAQLKDADQRWQGGVRRVAHPSGSIYQIYLHGSRGRLLMRCFKKPPEAKAYVAVFEALASLGAAALVFHGALFSASPEVTAWLDQQPSFWLVPVPADLVLDE